MKQEDRGQEATLELEPAAAAVMAGDRIDSLREFATDLAARGEELGLIGPLELPACGLGTC